MPDDFKQAIEQIKLRVPIEELVRERVPGLRKSGRLWTACCPFHEEGTPSFKVDPARGTWRCYGACGIGGDVISFLEKHDHLDFREALDVLSARSGVEIPSNSTNGARRKARGADDPLFEVLSRAAEYFKRMLQQPEGAQALEYLRARGLSAETIEAFGLGYSPAGGEVLVGKVLAQGQSLDPLLATGLARRNDHGRPYDFFRGRLMIPIRDERRRTLGFGARRLNDADKQAPKYVNTAESEVFHKGRLIYALDQAALEIRRSGHMVLVEGYTDVMAAHQVALRNVVAVLGTALTEEHAALVRRSGAKRVTLCFDGDSAGQEATWRALAGLLVLDIDIDVVRLSFDGRPELAGVKDPCDLLVRHGAAAFQAELERSTGWFDFLLASIDPLEDQKRWQAVDRVMELLARLQKPIQRDARLVELAAHLGVSAGAVRDHYQSLPARVRERSLERQRTERAQRPQNEGGEQASGGAEARVVRGPVARLSREEALIVSAWRHLIGAVLVEKELVGHLSALLGTKEHACPDPDLALLARDLVAMAQSDGTLPDLGGLMARLGEHPARDLMVPLIEDAETAESRVALFEGARMHLERDRASRQLVEHKAELARLATIDPAGHAQRLTELHRAMSREKFANTTSMVGESTPSPAHH